MGYDTREKSHNPRPYEMFRPAADIGGILGLDGKNAVDPTNPHGAVAADSRLRQNHDFWRPHGALAALFPAAFTRHRATEARVFQTSKSDGSLFLTVLPVRSSPGIRASLQATKNSPPLPRGGSREGARDRLTPSADREG